jgi:hypothetical protein
MILLQDRLTGGAGNVIVLHGVGFHALQTLILPAWLLEKVQINEKFKKVLIHTGSISWMLMVLLLGLQTAFGQSIFQLSILPILALLFLLIWFGTVCAACRLLFKKRREISVTGEVLE